LEVKAMKKILVVEDDPVSGSVLQRFLSAKGYETTVVRDGPSGVEAFRSEKPDMMIVDVQLPRKNGFEVCFEVKRTDDGRKTPVLLMSAVYTDQEHAQRHSMQGLCAQGYLVKPFEMKELLTEVERLLA
jgi:DNA-binding response OmpR family regulator